MLNRGNTNETGPLPRIHTERRMEAEAGDFDSTRSLGIARLIHSAIREGKTKTMRRLLNGTVALAITALAVTAAAVPSATAAPGNPTTPKVSQTVVVNEVATTGPNGQLDEFVEIRNNSTNPIDLSQWQVRIYNAANQAISTIEIPEGIVLSPKANVGQF